MIYQGSCHCGAIQFEVEAPKGLQGEECNCSICKKSGFLHLIIPKSKFHLIDGNDAIITYYFNMKVAKHTFCKHCGVKPFYTPRSNPDGIDVNIRCLDTNADTIEIAPFDGKNWELNAHKLAHKSKDEIE